MLFTCLTEVIERKQNFWIIKWVIFIIWNSHITKKWKTSFPFLIGNFCMGLLSHQVTRRFVHLQFCFHYFKNRIFTVFFWIQILHKKQRKLANGLHKNKLLKLVVESKKKKREKIFSSLVTAQFLSQWKTQNFWQIVIFNLRELTEVLNCISFLTAI